MQNKPVILIILDGFGVSFEKSGNAVEAANKPNLDFLEKNFPMTTLQASGVAVGLPWGKSGNSEVGHLAIGSGRVVYNHLPRIINAIQDQSFFKNEAFLKAAEHVKKNNSRLHLLGLVSSGSVHSYIDHLYALLEFIEKEKIDKSFLHVITDGKDSPPNEGGKFLSQLEERMAKEFPHTKIASVVGRFYAMDRDAKWDRIKKAYELLTLGKGEKIKKVSQYLNESYKKGVSDEFIEPAFVPTDIGTTAGAPAKTLETAGKPALVNDGDAMILFNFREDSVREISEAFIKENFDSFGRNKLINFLLVTLTEYEKNLPVLVAFPPTDIPWPLGRIVSEAGLKQLRIAETEKYAHVTYFFNGGKEKPFTGEDRILIQSLPASHFDEVPQMKAEEITQKILENAGDYDLIVANFANADMVGHTGNFDAAIKAVEALDTVIGKITGLIVEKNACLIITADHGNIELKMDPLTGEKLTEHSINPVPLIIAANNFKINKERSAEDLAKIKSEVNGVLTDIAPTILELLGIEKPKEMTGKSLLDFLKNQSA
ncbi:MAG: 2,3-bisphosphoglycerate-independent phosphoglycerate mutase [bacterium]|nr:2,3-bisphosphoglycerate-independent phosphoglycerate mutase [bacterium]